VGRLGRHKGQRFLVDVWASARCRFTRAARLVLVGGDEDGLGGRQALQRLIEDLGLRNEVYFMGEVSDAELRGWYARADLFALFSRYEAFGLVFFEAMIMGVPVLAHRVGANAELLRRGALLIHEYDYESAVEGLLRLVNDDHYRRRLGSEAQAYARQFAWDRVVDRFVALYQAVLRERREDRLEGA
jgi:glycosyltransferase involved in cell wall biosynthesis